MEDTSTEHFLSYYGNFYSKTDQNSKIGKKPKQALQKSVTRQICDNPLCNKILRRKPIMHINIGQKVQRHKFCSKLCKESWCYSKEI